jgi:hypothetical protein
MFGRCFHIIILAHEMHKCSKPFYRTSALNYNESKSLIPLVSWLENVPLLRPSFLKLMQILVDSTLFLVYGEGTLLPLWNAFEA